MGTSANSLVQGSDGNLYITQTVQPQTSTTDPTTGAIAQLTFERPTHDPSPALLPVSSESNPAGRWWKGATDLSTASPNPPAHRRRRKAPD